MNGKIICINAAIHKVLLENNTIIDTRVRGKLRNDKIEPVVGDNVIVDINTNTLEKVLPRKNYLVRPLISNIDKLLIVMSTSIPTFSSYLIDKFLLIAYSNNIEPIIIITKTDMISFKEKNDIKKYINYYRKLGIKVYINTSVSKIKKEFTGSVVALAGQTGSGKSSLLNRIDVSLCLKTGEVSESLGRGKHTTRLVELLELMFKIIIKNSILSIITGIFIMKLDKRPIKPMTKGLLCYPLFLASWLAINFKCLFQKDIKNYFKDFNKPCKYRTCLHIKEDGCEIIKLVDKGIIPKWRYENYLKFIEEVSNK